eukprot:4176029-Heterocapsa_arctica.AAC.1
MHKRAKTDEARLENKQVIDKSDTEYNSEMIKNIKILKNSIDEKNKRDIQEEEQRLNNIKIAEKKENNIIEKKKDKERQAELRRLSEINLVEEKEKRSFDTANAHLEIKQADLEQEVEIEYLALNEFSQNKKPRTDDKAF